MTTDVTSAASLQLPKTAHPDHLKKQAKSLLQAFRGGEAIARETVARFHPRADHFSGLRDAQLTLARSYGFADWQQLIQEAELCQLRSRSKAEQVEQFIQLACLRYNGDDRAWRYERAAQLLAQEPSLAHASFFSALVAGDFTAVKNFLDRDPSQAKTLGGPYHWPALMYVTYSRVPAAIEQVLAIVQLLHAGGADVDAHMQQEGYQLFSVLTGAMGEGERGAIDCPPHPHADVVAAALLAAGANPNEYQGCYNTMFTDSLDRWLPILLKHGLNSRHTTGDDGSKGETTFNFLLCAAAASGKLKRLHLLLQNGANPNAISRYSKRSCHTSALLNHHADCAAVLLQYGAAVEKLNVADQFRVTCWSRDFDKATAMLQQHASLRQDAQMFGDIGASDISLALWLVAQGFNINCQTRDGRTLLHRYAAGNELNAVRTLIEHGANPRLAEHHYGGTPLGFALHNRSWDVVEYLQTMSNDILDLCRLVDIGKVTALLAAQPDLVNTRTPMGNTPLHLVSQVHAEEPDMEASEQLIDLLLAHGASPYATNNQGNTPAEFYRQFGMNELAEYLAKAWPAN